MTRSGKITLGLATSAVLILILSWFHFHNAIPRLPAEQLKAAFEKKRLTEKEQMLLTRLESQPSPDSGMYLMGEISKYRFQYRQLFHKLLQLGLYRKFADQPEKALYYLEPAQRIARVFARELQDLFLNSQFHFIESLQESGIRRKLQCDYFYDAGRKALYAGDYSLAQIQYQYSLTLSRKIHDIRREVDNLLMLQYLKYDAGDYAKAMELAEKALLLAKSAGYRYREAWAHYSITNILFDRTEYPTALKHIESGLKIAKALDDQKAISSFLERQSIAFRRMGKFEQALLVVQKSLHMAEQADNWREILRCYINFGLIYRSMGEYSKSKIYYERALQVANKIHDQSNKAVALVNLGYLCQVLGLYDQALQYCLLALDLNVKKGNAIDISQALKSIGDIYFIQKEFSSARRYYQRALKELENSTQLSKQSSPRRLNGEIQLSLGDIYVQNHQGMLARQAYQKALKEFEAIEFKEGETLALIRLGNLFENQGDTEQAKLFLDKSVKLAVQLQDPMLLSNAFLAQGLFHKNQGDDAQAQQDFANSIQTIEDTREKILGSPQISYFATVQEVYEQMVLLQVQLGQKELAFNYSERSRARALLDLLQKSNQPVEAADRPAAMLLPIAQIQAQLEPNIQLVEFKVTRDKLLIFLIDKTHFFLKTAPVTRRQLRDLIFEFRKTIGAEETDKFYQRFKQQKQALYKQTLQQGRALFTKILAPIRDKLSPEKLIYLIPDDVLYYLPFSALALPDEQESPFLIQHFTLALAPSVTILSNSWLGAETTASPYRYAKILAIGNPSADLSGAQREVQNISRLFPGAQVLIGNKVNKDSLLTALAQPYNIVHFATHAIIDEAHPMESYLVLGRTHANSDGQSASPGEQQEVNTHLDAKEIYQLPLQGKALVTLSACQTAGGKLFRGEGILGLTHAFFQAGAASVVTSLWNIDDKYTERVMVAFYSFLKKRRISKALALRKAQEKIIQAMSRDEIARYPFPYAWAAFTLTGDYH